MLKPGGQVDGDEALEFYAKHTAQIEVRAGSSGRRRALCVEAFSAGRTAPAPARVHSPEREKLVSRDGRDGRDLEPGGEAETEQVH